MEWGNLASRVAKNKATTVYCAGEVALTFSKCIVGLIDWNVLFLKHWPIENQYKNMKQTLSAGSFRCGTRSLAILAYICLCVSHCWSGWAIHIVFYQQSSNKINEHTAKKKLSIGREGDGIVRRKQSRQGLSPFQISLSWKPVFLTVYTLGRILLFNLVTQMCDSQVCWRNIICFSVQLLPVLPFYLYYENDTKMVEGDGGTFNRKWPCRIKPYIDSRITILRFMCKHNIY